MNLLALRGIRRSFGALEVLRGIDLDMADGETLGLIGPNGAGKTTLFNLVSGFLPADAGSVAFAGRDLQGFSPAARARMGLVRSFQKSLVFPGLPVVENLALAVRLHLGGGYRWWRGRAVAEEAAARATELLDLAGLAGKADTLAGALPHGLQRVLDVLVALAQRPRLLLLDEPTAGLATDEAQRLLGLLRTVRPAPAVLLVAHDLDLVFGFCQRLAVLDLGRLIAVGPPDAVRADPGVQRAYLGELA
ncbi:MAG TPA: ABC transporter ATP-binding protein [Geminicoccus sp.]|uniref:ABC transporter ATP-binding protein n=1 Tax=Geminicoccus sp. TaxID=2024832 RepID=UPI002D104A7A|nr:ABC transporter ATP-binding protein [Geminicoccus sp.]HWL71524.1 ABC transporter ATP-binding protein [Geminicoccus sp.]